MLQILICDDNRSDGEAISAVLHTLSLSDTFSVSYTEQVKNMLFLLEDKNSHIDILLLDINFSNSSSGISQNGIDIADQVHKINPLCQIIFVSAHKGFFEQVYLTEHIAFLSKPVKPFYLKSALERAIVQINAVSDSSFVVISGRKNIRLRSDEVEYMEHMTRITQIHLSNGSITETYEKLNEILEKAKYKNFVRCHESYIVNFRFVTRHTVSEFSLVSQKKIPISYKYRNSIKSQFISYVTGGV